MIHKSASAIVYLNRNLGFDGRVREFVGQDEVPGGDMRYNALRIMKEALTGHKGWTPAWRDPEPQKHYDFIIVGGGGHGLSTAYYLAKEFKQSRIALLEKGWIGGGNVGRNTTIVRSNYQLQGNTPFYEFSLKLWEGLEQELNFNAMMSQRGVLMLYHNDAQRDAMVYRGNTMHINGVDAVLLNKEGVREIYPFLNFESQRFPIMGGLLQPRAGTARHDAVAWGYARGADSHGVDIIQNCEVTGFKIENGAVKGVETTRGDIMAPKVGVAVAGRSSEVMAKAGIRLPIESHVLQAFVSEGLKPILPGVITYGAGHFYISQSDKGGLVFGGNLDYYNSYAQRGNMPTFEEIVEEGVSMFPGFSRARVLRSWGGVMDMSMDGSPFIDKTSIDGLYFNGGWCYGGFKATPASGWCFAHLMATDRPHETATAYRLDRYRKGRMIDEFAAGAQPNLH